MSRNHICPVCKKALATRARLERHAFNQHSVELTLRGAAFRTLHFKVPEPTDEPTGEVFGGNAVVRRAG